MAAARMGKADGGVHILAALQLGQQGAIEGIASGRGVGGIDARNPGTSLPTPWRLYQTPALPRVIITSVIPKAWNWAAAACPLWASVTGIPVDLRRLRSGWG